MPVASIGDSYAALIGAVIGGLISFATTWGMAKRGETQDARAAAAILRANLLTCKCRIDKALKEKLWWPEPYSLPVENWRSEAKLPIAVKLSALDLDRLTWAFDEADRMNFVCSEAINLTTKPGETRMGVQVPLGKADDLLENALEFIANALVVLEPFKHEICTT